MTAKIMKLPRNVNMKPHFNSISRFYLFQAFASECQLDSDDEVRNIVKKIGDFLDILEKILCELESRKSISVECAKIYFHSFVEAYNGYGAWINRKRNEIKQNVKMNTLRMELCKLGNFDLHLKKQVQNKMFESQIEFVRFISHVKMSEFNRELNKEGFYTMTIDFFTTRCYTDVYGYFFLPRVKIAYELCWDKRFQIEYLKGHRFPFIGKDNVGDDRIEEHWTQMRKELESGNGFQFYCLFMEIYWNFSWASENLDNHKSWCEFIHGDYYKEQIIQKKWTNETLELVIMEIIGFISKEDMNSSFQEIWDYLRSKDGTTFMERIFAYLRFAYETILLLITKKSNKMLRRLEMQNLSHEHYLSFIRGFFAHKVDPNFGIPNTKQWILQSMLGVPRETLHLMIQNHIPTIKFHLASTIYNFMEISEVYEDVPELLYLEYDKLQKMWHQVSIFQTMCIHFVTMRQHMPLSKFNIAKEEVADILLGLMERGEELEISDAFFGVASKFIQHSSEIAKYDQNIRTRLDPNDAVFLLIQDRLKLSWTKGESLDSVCGVQRLETLFKACGQTFRRLVVLNVTLHGEVYKLFCQNFARQVLIVE